MNQITKNCHYISRTLTRPWEGEKRRLHFYDFDALAWDDDGSKMLFAEDSINSQHVEAWLNEVIEQPLTVWRRRFAAGASDVLEDQASYRAATLMLWLQGTRVKSISDHVARRDLERLAQKSIDETNQLVTAFQEEYDLAIATTVGKEGMLAPIFFPSSGIFPLSYRDTGCLSGNAIAIAQPLDMWNVLVALPRDNMGVRDLSRIPSSISNFSVGVANARRVVVPPILLEQQPKAGVARLLTEQRASNEHLLALVKDTKRLVAEAFEVTGLDVPRDGTGRFPPRQPG